MGKILIYLSTFSPFNDADILVLNKLNNEKYKKIFLISIKNDDSTEYDFLMIKKGIKSSFQRKNFVISNSYYDEKKLLDLVINNRINGYKCDLLIKEENLYILDKFKEKEKLLSLSKLIVYPKINSLFNLDYHYLDVCYSNKEEDIRNGKKLSAPLSILNIIADKKIYYAKELASMMKERRYIHSVSVAKTCYHIAKNNNVDPNLMYQAGIFHDCGKDIDYSYQQEIMNEYYYDFINVPSFAYHQFVGSYLANKKFKIDDERVLNSIKYHCTGKADMNIYQKILYAADKCEPKREFKTDNIRRECVKDIDTGFVLTIKDQIKYFKKNNIEPSQCDLTKNMYDYYLKEGEKYAKEN